MHASCFNHVRFYETLWTIAHQAPLSMGFSREEYWSGLPFPSLRDLPDPGIKPVSLIFLHWQVGSLPVGPPGKPQKNNKHKWKCNEGGLPQPPETRDRCYGCYQNTGGNGKLPVLSTGLTDWTRITHTHTHTHTGCNDIERYTHTHTHTHTHTQTAMI